MSKIRIPNRNMGSLMGTVKTVVIDKTAKPVDEYSWDVPPDNRPAFQLNGRDFPAIQNWKVGERYKLEIEVEMTSSKAIDTKGGNTIIAGFRINTIKEEEPYEGQQ